MGAQQLQEKTIKQEVERINARQIQTLTANNHPTWWQVYRQPSEDTQVPQKQITMIETGLKDVGEGINTPINKHRIEATRKEMKAEEIDGERSTMDSTVEEYRKNRLDPKLYKLKRGKAAGPDGWTQDAARAIINSSPNAMTGYQQRIRTCITIGVIPIWNKRARTNPKLTPNKKGTQHTGWRNLTLMSIWKKKLENALDFIARNMANEYTSQHWKPGQYQG